jgi:CRP/FNR family transcriptional regulator
MDEIVTKKIDTFFAQFRQQTYKKGEILIRADDIPTGIFYLNSGQVKEYAISRKGDEIVINVFKPPAFFPMSWAMNDTPNAYFFEAMTDSRVARAPREEVLAFIKNNPDVLYNLMKRVYKGTDGILTRMTYLMSGNAYTRLIAELLIYGKRFGNLKSLGKGLLEISISEKDLAALSGMTRETVSREIKVLKDNGLVTFEKNNLLIKDVKKLEEELEKED